MSKQDQLEDLLVEWGLKRQQGNELSVEELCKDDPGLIPDLSELINDIKNTDWLEEDDDDDDDFLHLPDFSTVSNHANETWLPECKLSVNDFCQRLVASGLMQQEQVSRLTKYCTDNARKFAEKMVQEKRITTFQATVLLEGRNIPLVLGRYVILEEIGRGGMGTVYKALHQQMDRVVALKILPKEAVDSIEKVRRFNREVRVAAKLEHPNIVTTHDASEDMGYHYLVMSLVKGSDLAAYVRKRGPLSVATAVDYIAQAARGLDHAHQLGIIHRDIKPGNLLLNTKGQVKILDMGLAWIDPDQSRENHTFPMALTEAGAVMGTVAYLPPEQALDTRTADARSDIYSLGCTLFFLLTGKPIYSEETAMKTIMAHREQEIPSLCDQREDVPHELDAAFHKMVAKKPEDRFQSMTDLVAALESLDIKDEDGAQPVVAGPQAFQDTATVIDTSREVIKPQPATCGEPPKRRWGMIVACLLGLMGFGGIWAAGIFLTVETPEGTIVLEINQPELLGAVVSVDGEKKITIRTRKGQEPIVVKADQKKHTLKVAKGGFQTFTRMFSVKGDGTQTIDVWLEPLQQDVAVKSSTVRPRSHVKWNDRQVGEWVLEGGGTVQTVSPQKKLYQSAEELPEEGFRISAITLQHDAFDDHDLKRLWDLKSLTTLTLGSQNRNPQKDRGLSDAGLANLCGVKTLSHLTIYGPHQLSDKGLSHLSRLVNLKELEILNKNGSGDSTFTDRGLAQLADLPNLNKLLIQTNGGGINGTGLKGFQQLEVLGMSGVPLSESGTETIGQLKQLKTLYTNAVIDDSTLRHWKGLTNLEALHLFAFGSQITDSGIKHLSNLKSLKHLAVWHSQITDDCLPYLKNLKNLEVLKIEDNNMSPQGIAELQKALPNCKIEHDFTEEEIEAATKVLKPKKKDKPVPAESNNGPGYQ